MLWGLAYTAHWTWPSCKPAEDWRLQSRVHSLHRFQLFTFSFLSARPDKHGVQISELCFHSGRLCWLYSPVGDAIEHSHQNSRSSCALKRPGESLADPTCCPTRLWTHRLNNESIPAFISHRGLRPGRSAASLVPSLQVHSLEQNEMRAQCSASDRDWEPSLPRRTFDEADLTVTARSLARIAGVLASGPIFQPSGFPEV